jgi:hypothetical protein
VVALVARHNSILPHHVLFTTGSSLAIAHWDVQ